LSSAAPALASFAVALLSCASFAAAAVSLPSLAAHRVLLTGSNGDDENDKLTLGLLTLLWTGSSVDDENDELTLGLLTLFGVGENGCTLSSSSSSAIHLANRRSTSSSLEPLPESLARLQFSRRLPIDRLPSICADMSTLASSAPPFAHPSPTLPPPAVLSWPLANFEHVAA